MNEYLQILVFGLKGLSILLFAILYMLGGRNHKWLRRYLGSALFGTSVILFSLWQSCYSPLLWLYPVALCISLHFGYGADSFWDKVKRRAIYGLALGGSSLVVAFVNGSYILACVQIGIALLASIVLGVFNPFKAVDEEGLIASFGVCMVPFMIGV